MVGDAGAVVAGVAGATVVVAAVELFAMFVAAVVADGVLSTVKGAAGNAADDALGAVALWPAVSAAELFVAGAGAVAGTVGAGAVDAPGINVSVVLDAAALVALVVALVAGAWVAVAVGVVAVDPVVPGALEAAELAVPPASVVALDDPA